MAGPESVAETGLDGPAATATILLAGVPVSVGSAAPDGIGRASSDGVAGVVGTVRAAGGGGVAAGTAITPAGGSVCSKSSVLGLDGWGWPVLARMNPWSGSLRQPESAISRNAAGTAVTAMPNCPFEPFGRCRRRAIPLGASATPTAASRIRGSSRDVAPGTISIALLDRRRSIRLALEPASRRQARSEQETVKRAEPTRCRYSLFWFDAGCVLGTRRAVKRRHGTAACD